VGRQIEAVISHVEDTLHPHPDLKQEMRVLHDAYMEKKKILAEIDSCHGSLRHLHKMQATGAYREEEGLEGVGPAFCANSVMEGGATCETDAHREQEGHEGLSPAFCADVVMEGGASCEDGESA